MGDPSPKAIAALVGGANAQQKFKQFLQRYNQKYFPSTAQSTTDLRMNGIFGMLRETAENNYKSSPDSSLLNIESDAVVFAVVPYTPPPGSSVDADTGFSSDAAPANWSRFDLKCYILSDPRSRVASPSIDIILEALQISQTTGQPSVILNALPTFSYDLAAMREAWGVTPIVGDIVKVKSDSSSILSGVCTGITKVNIGDLLSEATRDLHLLLDDFGGQARLAMKTKVASSIGESVTCIATGAPRYNIQGMSISPQGKRFIAQFSNPRGCVYDDRPDTNFNAADWMGPSTRGGSPHSRWKWADYYMPQKHGTTGNWGNALKPGYPWGVDSIPSIGDGHAIKVQDPDWPYDSLAGGPVDERELFEKNFKQDLDGMPSRKIRQKAKGGYESKDARIGYNPHEDPAPLSPARIAELRDADIKIRCAFFKTEINEPITQYQFDALASLCFDKGPPFWGLKKIIKEINEGNCDEAAKWFMKSDRSVVTGKNAAKVERRILEAKLFAGYGYAGTQGIGVFVAALNEHRQAATEVFIESKGKYKKWVKKSGWFDQQRQQNETPVVQAPTVGQNIPAPSQVPCSSLYPAEEPGSETVVYGLPGPACGNQTG